MQKIRLISSSREIVENLRVCATDSVTGIYNCGRCEKCLRTMIGLHIAGALGDCGTLPDTIDTDLVRRFHVSNEIARDALLEMSGALGTSDTDRNIKEALQECLARIHTVT